MSRSASLAGHWSATGPGLAVPACEERRAVLCCGELATLDQAADPFSWPPGEAARGVSGLPRSRMMGLSAYERHREERRLCSGAGLALLAGLVGGQACAPSVRVKPTLSPELKALAKRELRHASVLSHSITVSDVEEGKPYPNEHACRLKDPADFQADSFRRTKRKHDGKEYSIIMGRLKKPLNIQAHGHTSKGMTGTEA